MTCSSTLLSTSAKLGLMSPGPCADPKPSCPGKCNRAAQGKGEKGGVTRLRVGACRQARPLARRTRRESAVRACKMRSCMVVRAKAVRDMVLRRADMRRRDEAQRRAWMREEAGWDGLRGALMLTLLRDHCVSLADDGLDEGLDSRSYRLRGCQSRVA
jgi:hypothetical protein